MHLTRKHLSRRTLLRGTGVAVGLPLLDAMIPAATALANTAAAPKLRAGFFYIPHGAIMWNTAFGPEMDRWTPSADELGAHARARHVAFGCPPRREGHRREDGADDRPDDRGPHRQGQRAAVARSRVRDDAPER